MRFLDFLCAAGLLVACQPQVALSQPETTSVSDDVVLPGRVWPPTNFMGRTGAWAQEKDSINAARVEQGEAYYFGRGVAQDYEEARRLFLEASFADACNGHMGIWVAPNPRAVFYLGEMAHHGRGGPRDPVTARRYYRQAAAAGVPEARAALDALPEVERWVSDAEASERRASRLAPGFGTPDFPPDSVDTPSYVEAARLFRQAAELFRRAAERGDPYATFRLGEMTGWRVPGDSTERLRLYNAAAEGGHLEAQRRLAFMYDAGRGVAESDSASARYYRMAAENGDREARLILGVMYEHGIGVPKDRAEAERLYRDVAGAGGALERLAAGAPPDREGYMGEVLLRRLEAGGNPRPEEYLVWYVGRPIGPLIEAAQRYGFYRVC